MAIIERHSEKSFRLIVENSYDANGKRGKPYSFTTSVKYSDHLNNHPLPS
ncbi:hypothetical protein P4829_06715 [Bacillus atrophaeus]|nr:hypothetical protein [Bacillus atrophaeus]WFE15375.1 hypothetical protein P4829_06715 [Bacillus atrophaeus]